MKNEPTELEKYQELRIKALTKEVEDIYRDYAELENKFLVATKMMQDLAPIVKLGRERILQTVKNNAFNKPIQDRDYSV